ncbi:MAG TPA: hypothetical protein VNI78_03160 [Vicinamibacterales bacterium]|nr:hypothetical protein [Vicinamibacterales bacterium]
MYAVHRRAGAWELMLHANLFAQFLYESAADEHRQAEQAGSINWLMGMARRPVGAGVAGLRAMLSLEPWTIPGCGYPDLLATGETCDGETIHDRQHPHDLFMELAAEYGRPLAGPYRWQLYGGLAGEPALGPVAYPHRLSALPNLVAPIGHHWLDATHITFGVVTAGVYSDRIKVEASVFNGREPDENRTDLDLAPLDSFAGRLTFAPTPVWTLQVSAGRLAEAEEGHDGGPRIDVTRVTASAIHYCPLGSAGWWAATLAWGANVEEGRQTNAVLAESVFTFNGLDTWFGRLEAGGKPAHDLHVHESDEVFTVGKVQIGYVRYFSPAAGWQPGVGASLSLSIVGSDLAPRYGGRVAPGFGVFVTLRPAVHRM